MGNYLYDFSSIEKNKQTPVWIKIKMGKLWQDLKNHKINTQRIFMTKFKIYVFELQKNIIK